MLVVRDSLVAAVAEHRSRAVVGGVRTHSAEHLLSPGLCAWSWSVGLSKEMFCSRLAVLQNTCAKIGLAMQPRWFIEGRFAGQRISPAIALTGGICTAKSGSSFLGYDIDRQTPVLLVGGMAGFCKRRDPPSRRFSRDTQSGRAG